MALRGKRATTITFATFKKAINSNRKRNQGKKKRNQKLRETKLFGYSTQLFRILGAPIIFSLTIQEEILTTTIEV